MRILISTNSMDNYSGAPMSTYESARVLAKDHDVTVVCGLGGWNGNELQQNLEKLGVVCGYTTEPEYDLIIASHHCPPVKGFLINVVRGTTQWEVPLANADIYVCIRPDIQEHIIKEYHIPPEKTVVIYNGVDRTRFIPRPKTPRDHIKIVAPCNVDSIRLRWLEMMVALTNKDRQLYIYTNETKFTLPQSPWVHYEKPVFHMEYPIADADVVVGIYLGRVNLEARSCNVPSIIYDPVDLTAEGFEIDEVTFDEHHNIENVVKKILSLYENRK